jgi:1-deoxy-D-xylulose-5-phosphate synthase
MAASDDLELARMIYTCADINHAPSAFRYPRGSGTGIEINYPIKKLTIGKGKIIQEGKDIAIISYGARLQEVKLASKKLEDYKISTTIADARFCKPLDKKLIIELCKNHKLLVTIEEGSIGGFGSHVLNFLINEYNSLLQKTIVDCIYFPDKFIDQDTPFNMYNVANMNSEGIINRVLKKLNIKKNSIKV